jgi:hypothetical protein
MIGEGRGIRFINGIFPDSLIFFYLDGLGLMVSSHSELNLKL